MGYVYRSPQEIEAIKRRQQEREDEEDARRKRFAKKIVTVLVDRINNEVVRPGPKPEERECYDVANELRDMTPELVELVSAVIAVADKEGR